MSTEVSLDQLTSLCLRRGFFYPSGRIYGGLKGFYDYGPLGAELRREILDDWWWFFVRRREDVIGLHGCIITHPSVWKASGHVDEFFDYLVVCQRCGREYRADHLLEDRGIQLKTVTLDAIAQKLREEDVKCPECGGQLSAPEPFNLMFATHVGPKKTSVAYLRPETAQLIFANFRDVWFTMRLSLPFGIAQVGRVFRNEISPRNFLFRLREFEQMELEFFFNPAKGDECPLFSEVEDLRCRILTAAEQEEGAYDGRVMRIGEAWRSGVFGCKWHAYWVGESLLWLERIGVDLSRIRVREHVKSELAHYTIQTFDIEYNFPYMGWKEIVGVSNRGDYDLRRHQEFSGKDLAVEEDGEKVLPHVIEPSFGLERVIMTVLTDAYKVVDGRLVLKLSPRIAPLKVAVYPIVSKPEFVEKAREISRQLRREFTVLYDDKGSIGKRYVRGDEIGIPFAVTVDGQTLEDNTVTIRFRDTREQIRVGEAELPDTIRSLINQVGAGPESLHGRILK